MGGSDSLLTVLISNFDVLAGPVVSLVYPLYASVRAIETKSPVDDQQWLTYWVLYSFITLFELTFGALIEWLPFWSYAKLIFNCWLVLPQFNGAAYVYDHFVRPMFVNQQMVNIWYVPRKESAGRPSDVLAAAERYVEQNGPEAIQKLANKIMTEIMTGASMLVGIVVESISKSTKASNYRSTVNHRRRSILEEVEAERIARAEQESRWNGYPVYDDPDRRF